MPGQSYAKPAFLILGVLLQFNWYYIFDVIRTFSLRNPVRDFFILKLSVMIEYGLFFHVGELSRVLGLLLLISYAVMTMVDIFRRQGKK